MNIKTEKRICAFCGKEFVDNFTTTPHKYCSELCRNRINSIREGRTKMHQEETRQCVICGKTFTTYILHKKTCSEKCSKLRHDNHKRRDGYVRKYDDNDRAKRKEYDRQKYLAKHPGARSQKEISERKRLQDLAKASEQERKQKEQEEARAKREAQKQANIAYWQNYEAEHICEVCGNKYIAHYPLTKYCSKSCARKVYKVRDNRHRYKNITVDKGITLPKLAKRDRNQCKICGLFVDWNDFVKTDKTKICGDMYPSIDHITPISLGGLHSWDNVQLAHRGCNTKKNNRFIG